MRRMLFLVMVLASGCALGGGRGEDAGVGADAAPVDAGRIDAGVRVDAAGMDAGGDSGARIDGGGRVDGGPRTDSGPAATDAGPARDAGSLSSELSLPDPSGASCSNPGSLSECPGIEVCRFYTPGEGRCESCEPCGNLGASCGASAHCDILFMCFRGRCTNFCTLGTSECGPPADCLDIGHPTRGVCRP